jgi:hypothetical protein
MLTTPETIRTLQRKLYRKAKQEPAYRFYALYDKIHRADILSHAYHLVRANKGSAGIDGVTFEAIETGEGVTAFLAELQEALKSKTYAPSPVKQALKEIKDSVTILTHRRMTPVPLKVIIEKINTALRGWVGYFHYRNCSQAFGRLKFHVEARVRTHLRKRHKIKSRAAGFTKFTNRSLYERYGLYKVPTTAGWTNAHAVR